MSTWCGRSAGFAGDSTGNRLLRVVFFLYESLGPRIDGAMEPKWSESARPSGDIWRGRGGVGEDSSFDKILIRHVQFNTVLNSNLQRYEHGKNLQNAGVFSSAQDGGED